MYFYLLLGISFLLLGIIIRQKRAFFYQLAKGSLSLLNELISEEDEDEKIEEIQKSTNLLLLSFLKIFSLLAIALTVAAIPVILYSILLDIPYESLDLGSGYAILAISIGATIPFLFPIKKSISGYSELSQLLHHMFLDNYHIADKLFKREKKLIEKNQLELKKEFVIVTGLARAGTTSLMNDIAKLSVFTSLNYANMPLLTAPNLWAKIYKPKKKALKERSHQDGILIGLDSNEALEEYFFKMKAKDSFIQDETIDEYTFPEEDYLAYLAYQAIIKNDNQRIYLAKNNNFILRYQSIRKLNEQFLTVVLFRDPLSQAASLLEKHHSYSKMQEEDSFVLEYMNWLGHHEFGLNQKPFQFKESNQSIDAPKEHLDFWIQSWINYYSQAMKMRHPKTLFINYETYCQKPGKVIQHILDQTSIEIEIPEFRQFHNNRKGQSEASEQLLTEANTIYKELCNLAVSI